MGGRWAFSLTLPLRELDALMGIGFFGRERNAWTALWSDPGCTLQQPHSDFKLTNAKLRSCGGVPDDIEQRAFSMLFCTSDGGILPIWVDDDNLEQFQLLQLNRGDVCFFHSDVTHAGAPYALGHRYRIHVHLDSKQVYHLAGYVEQVKMSKLELQRLNDLVASATQRLSL